MPLASSRACSTRSSLLSNSRPQPKDLRDLILAKRPIKNGDLVETSFEIAFARAIAAEEEGLGLRNQLLGVETLCTDAIEEVMNGVSVPHQREVIP